MRISSPPTRHPCHYGIDTPRRKELIAASQGVEEIRKFTGADTLGYLSLEGMLGAFGRDERSVCAACFSGRYPVPFSETEIQPVLFEVDESGEVQPVTPEAPAPPAEEKREPLSVEESVPVAAADPDGTEG